MDIQLNALYVPPTNFFVINSLLSDVVLKFRKNLEEKKLINI